MTVDVTHRVGRPATSDVVEEETRHIARTRILVTRPAVRIRDGQPWSNIGADLGGEVVALEGITTVANQPLLVEECATEVIVRLTTAPRDGDVVLVSRDVLAVHLVEPIGVRPSSRVEIPCIGTLIPDRSRAELIIDRSILIVYDALHDLVGEDGTIP